MRKFVLRREHLNFDELSEKMEVIQREEQRIYVGGDDGTASNPYTWDEYERLEDSGSFYGGYVTMPDNSVSYMAGDGGSSYATPSGVVSGNYGSNDDSDASIDSGFFGVYGSYGTNDNISGNNIVGGGGAGGYGTNEGGYSNTSYTFSGLTIGYGIRGVLDNYTYRGTVSIRNGILYVGVGIHNTWGNYPTNVSATISVYKNDQLVQSKNLTYYADGYITNDTGFQQIGDASVELPTDGSVKVVFKIGSIFNDFFEGNGSVFGKKTIYSSNR